MFFIRVSFMACLLVSDFLFYSSLGFGLLSFCSVLPWWFVRFFCSPRFAPRFFFFSSPLLISPKLTCLLFSLFRSMFASRATAGSPLRGESICFPRFKGLSCSRLCAVAGSSCDNFSARPMLGKRDYNGAHCVAGWSNDARLS